MRADVFLFFVFFLKKHVLFQRLSTAALVKFDPVTETVVKDKKGR